MARADGLLTKTYDLAEAIKRIQAFDAAGADCLYAPMPPGMQSLRKVVQATEKPVNVLAAGPFARHSRAEFADLGIARISLGSALARVTHRVIHDAATAMFEHGSFATLTLAMPGGEVDEMLKK